MSKDVETPPLSRKVRAADIEENVPLAIDATRAEMTSIAALLGLASLDNLNLDYRLRLGGQGRVQLTGRLKANVTQTCVVSLDPIEASIDVPVAVEFWPAPLIADLESRVEDPRQSGLLDWPEAIVDGTLDLGPVIYETLATALDPYPKREGASFEWSQGGVEPEDGESGPFAALKQLKEP
ncbi:MAG: YceD family protein [Methyloceanibacter sp.]|uniref:YceD family protein n=1 Tax=Methyloceanibacter sp. TaxID=1965321 RepID=UPI003D6CA75A